jgi:hypothetical protein
MDAFVGEQAEERSVLRLELRIGLVPFANAGASEVGVGNLGSLKNDKLAVRRGIELVKESPWKQLDAADGEVQVVPAGQPECNCLRINKGRAREEELGALGEQIFSRSLGLTWDARPRTRSF